MNSIFSVDVRWEGDVLHVDLTLLQIDLRFINRYTDTWPAGISCMSGGIIDMKKLVTHVFPLEKASDGLILSSDHSKGSIKVHIVDDTETVIF